MTGKRLRAEVEDDSNLSEFAKKMRNWAQDTANFVEQLKNFNPARPTSTSPAQFVPGPTSQFVSQPNEFDHYQAIHGSQSPVDSENVHCSENDEDDYDLKSAYFTDSDDSIDSENGRNQIDEEIDFCQSTRVEMNESERIMIILLHQARNNTTNTEVEQLVSTINNLAYRECCIGGKIPLIDFTCWDTLISKVSNAFYPVISKYFYSRCGDLVGPISDKKDMTLVSSCSYKHKGCEIIPQHEFVRNDDVTYFCSISLIEWLRHQVPLHYTKLRFLQTTSNSRSYHDLSDGERYKQLVTPKFDMEKKVDHILTLTVTWDGVAITEDGKKSMWPLCCYLNELPFQDRINNAMLIALHSGKSKPKSDIMLKPMVDELLQFDFGQDLLD